MSASLPYCDPVADDLSSAAHLRALFDTYFDYVWKFVRRMGVTMPEVDDVVQEVFMVASRRLASIEPGKERAYLTGIALRVCSQARRSERRRRTQPLDDSSLEREDPCGPTTEEVLDLQRARKVLDEILEKMPPEVRAVFVLVELEQLTLHEVALAFDAPLGTIKSRLRKGKQLFDEHAERQYRQATAQRGSSW